MKFFLNERLLLSGRTLKCLLTDSEAAPEPVDVRAAQFRVVDPNGQTRAVENRPPGLPTILEGRRGLISFSAVQWSSENVFLGQNVAESLIDKKVVAQRDFVVLKPKEYGYLLESTEGEKIARENRRFESVDDVRRSWRQSWRDVLSYLGGPKPEHIRWQTELQNVTQTDLEVLSVDAFAWMNFHINRFLLNRVFYGGDVQVERTSRTGASEFVARLITRTPLSSEDDIQGELEELQRLAGSLDIDGIHVQLRWRAVGEFFISWVP